MSLPDYLVCLECDTPCYSFEWRNEKPYDIFCTACGNEDPDLFVRPEDVDELDLDWDRKTGRSRGRTEEPAGGGQSAPGGAGRRTR